MENAFMITGATGGLGKAFAAACARRGFDLFLTDVSPILLDTLAGGLRKEFGITVLTRVADLARAEGRDALFDWLDGAGLRFSGLVNAAGMDKEGEFAAQSLGSIRTMMELNMLGSVECINKLLALREEGGPFTVINVASLAAFQPMPYKALYASTKRFLVQLSLGIREELKPYGVAVSALCPGGMPTTKACLESMEAQGILGRLSAMNAEEVAERALRQALKGRAVIVPGLVNRALSRLSSLVPGSFAARLVARKWSRVLVSRCGSLRPQGNMCGTPRLADGEKLY
jgi:uncharacterized protein